MTALTDKLKADVAGARERHYHVTKHGYNISEPLTINSEPIEAHCDRADLLATLDTALDVIEAQEELVEASQGIRKALHQWLMDHSDRCRICTDKSTQAIKAASNAAMRLNHVITAALGDKG